MNLIFLLSCQTLNKKNPTTINDVLGVEGRIVKAGKKTLISGDIIFGGSKHVASAVLQVNKKFLNIRSAINIKYEKSTVNNLRKKGLKVASYDRSKEPKHIKKEYQIL